MPIQIPLIDANTLYQLLYVQLLSKDEVANIYATSVFTIDSYLDKYQFQPAYDNVTPMFAYVYANTLSSNAASGLYANTVIFATANAAFAKANANINLTGPITSVGNVTTIASKTGNGNTVAMNDAPVFTNTVTFLGVANVASGQTKFPATQNASTDVNTLDDYKEGQFTITDSSGNNLVLTVNANSFIKIGRCVTFTIHVVYPATSNTAQAMLATLPFAAQNICCAICYTSGSGGYPMVAQIASQTLSIYKTGGLPALNANLSGAFLIITGSYFTAS